MTNLKNSTALDVARARVRAEVRDYFRALGGHGQIVPEEIAEGELDAADHAEAMLNAADERDLDLAARYDLNAETLREALEAECSDVIEEAILDFETSIQIHWAPLTDANRAAFIETIRGIGEAGIASHVELLEECLETAEGDQVDVIEDRLAVLEGELYARAAMA